MPVVLAEADWDRWLDPAFSDTGKLSELLRPFETGALEAWPVSRAVNAPKNQGPELIARGGLSAHFCVQAPAPDL